MQKSVLILVATLSLLVACDNHANTSQVTSDNDMESSVMLEEIQLDENSVGLPHPGGQLLKRYSSVAEYMQDFAVNINQTGGQKLAIQLGLEQPTTADIEAALNPLVDFSQNDLIVFATLSGYPPLNAVSYEFAEQNSIVFCSTPPNGIQGKALRYVMTLYRIAKNAQVKLEVCTK